MTVRHIGSTRPPMDGMDPVYVSVEENDEWPGQLIAVEVGDLSDPRFLLTLERDEAAQLSKILGSAVRWCASKGQPEEQRWEQLTLGWEA